MAKPLRQLWQEHGYTSAKQLADEVGVSTSTMSRYESNPEEIPTSKACAIADALGVTVDEVLGRDLPSPERSRLQEYYDSLDESGQALFDEFVAFSKFRRDVPSQAQRDAITADTRTVQLLEKELLNARVSEDPYSGDYLFGTPEERRAAFEGFITDWYREQFAEELAATLTQIDRQSEQGFIEVEAIGEWYPGIMSREETADFFDEVADYRNDYQQYASERNPKRLASTVKRLMGAYDHMHS